MSDNDNQVIEFLHGSWVYSRDPDGTGEKKGFHLPGLDDTSWPGMNIPCHWHRSGLDYHGKVWFRKTFASALEGPVRLCFNGVDYSCRVWLNGEYLGSHTGYFQPFAFNLSGRLKRGSNLVAVEVDGSYDEGFPFKKKFFKGGLSHWDMRPGGWTVRGQDVSSAGIWAPVFLAASGPVSIKDLVTWTRMENGRWTIETAAMLFNHLDRDAAARLELNLSPGNFSSSNKWLWTEGRMLRPGDNGISLKFEVDEPELWWTWDTGNPNVYELAVAVIVDGRVSDRKSSNAGFRHIERKRDGIYLNGRRVFLKGACYLSSLWPGEMSRESSLRDIELAKGANMNSLRVAYHVEPLHFYDLCDEAGLLLWQDFSMLWDYDTSSASRDEAERQIAGMVRLLGGHPSIYMWVCHCEPLMPSNRRMDRQLARVVRTEEKAGRIIKPSTQMSEHPFYGWYFGTKLGFAGLPGKPMPNEFGAQSLPARDAQLWQDLGDDSWPPNTRWEYHNYQADLFFSMRDCATLDDMISRSQSYQSEVLDFAIQAFRRGKGRIIGTYIFTFADAWPSITWSIVDWERRPKAAYHAVKEAYKPVKLSLDIVQGKSIPHPFMGWLAWNHCFDIGGPFRAKVYVINDRHEHIENAVLKWTLSGPSREIKRGEKNMDVKADSSEPAVFISIRLPADIEPGQYILSSWLYKDGDELDRESIELYFGHPGSRFRNARLQLREWLRAEMHHVVFALKSFPLSIARALTGSYRRYFRSVKR